MSKGYTLFGKQQETVNNIISRLKDDTVNDFYLSGELGVGKTYMGVELIKHYKSEGYTPFIVVPSIVLKKWETLLEDIGNIVRFTRQGSKTHEFECDDNIYIITTDNLNAYLDNHLLNRDDLTKDNKIVLLWDEIHLAKKTRLDALKKMKVILNSVMYKALYLTGTITEGSSKDVASIIYETHIRYGNSMGIERDDLSELIFENFAGFISSIWRYISIAVALEDIDEIGNKSTEERQEVLPIDYIPLDTESILLTDLIYSTLTESNVNNERAKDIRLTFLDDPTKKQIHVKQSRHSKFKIKGGSSVILGLPMNDLDIKNTTKFKKLLEIIENNKHDKVLVYVTDYSLMRTLSKELNHLDIPSFYLKSNVKKENYSSYINEQFIDNRVGIVDPSKVNVGVDIHAEQLVWYQFMQEIDKMIQAQRRVARLSSQYKSKVHMLVYEDEYDKDRALELSNAVKNNAVTYGVKQEDSLAKLTGIILEGIN